MATQTAWTRAYPFSGLVRAVAVADYAARPGGPVIPPADLADPGRHLVRVKDGHGPGLRRAETGQGRMAEPAGLMVR